MLTLTKYLLGPVLLAQGWHVRRTIVKLPEPEGARSGKAGEAPSLSLLILGDSAAAGVGVSHQAHALSGQLAQHLAFPARWDLLAQTGHTTADTVTMLEAEPARHFDTVLISLGVNDVTSGLSVRQYLDNTEQLITLLRAKFTARHIIFSGLPPVSRFPALPHPLRWYLGRVSKRFDAALRALIESQQCDYLYLDQGDDMQLIAEDGFHPGPQVYAQWARAAAEKINQHARQSDALGTKATRINQKS